MKKALCYTTRGFLRTRMNNGHPSDGLKLVGCISTPRTCLLLIGEAA